MTRTVDSVFRPLRAAAMLGILLWVAGLPSARSEPAEVWKKVALATVSPTAAIPSLDGLSRELGGIVAGTSSGSVTVFAEEEARATPLAERIEAALALGTAALDAAGLSVDGFEPISVLLVRATTGATGSVASASGRTILVRERTTTIGAGPLGPRKRTDGVAPRAEVASVSDAALVALDERAGLAGASGGPGSIGNAIARALVRRISFETPPPAWLHEGLVGWVETCAVPTTPSEGFHLCGGAASLGPGLFSPKFRPSGAQARLLARLVGEVLAGKSDGAARIERLSAPGDGAAALEAALGAPVKDRLAALAMSTKSEKAPCDATATIPCPLCKGGKVEAACDGCEALGQVACPSCDGMSGCFAPGCCDGIQIRTNGLFNCGMCKGTTWFFCRVCADKGRFPCLVCRGSGRAVRTCFGCRGKGRVPCPDSGGAVPADGEAPPCTWCRDPAAKSACPTCHGSGFDGCRRCRGSGEVPCPNCHGLGCDACFQYGFRSCPDGEAKKQKCGGCAGSGRVEPSSKGCLACSGSGKAPDGRVAALRTASRRSSIDAASRARNAEVVRKAITFLKGSTALNGAFALRAQRWLPNGSLGDLDQATLFSNALVLWVLLAAGVPADDAVVAEALRVLEARALSVVEGRIVGKDVHVQSVSLALRALVAAGIDPKGELVSGLVSRLAAAQRPSGYWANALDTKDPGSAFPSLFAVESLWLAQRRGAKVPAATFNRALSAGLRLGSTVQRKMGKTGFLTATDVASQTALIVFAKAGGLGEKAKDLDEYRSIPQVAQGVAWIDRYFDLEREPIVAQGALVRGSGDGGYFAWIYAIERLARLLSIPELGGRRWYAEGCRRLASIQLADGGFEELGLCRMNGPVRCTSFALLFLTRATPPITSEATSLDEAELDAEPDASK